MNQVHTPRGAKTRSAAGGALVAVAGLLAALALVYTNATGVAEIASDAQLQQRVESALGATASTRNAIGQALLLSGSSGDDSLTQAAVAEARSILAEMTQRIEIVASNATDGSPVTRVLELAVHDAENVLNAVADGDLETAGPLATGPSADSFAELITVLRQLRNDLARSIAGAAAQSGTVATASRFTVAFLVPSLALILAFAMNRRRRRREQLATELEQERALSKSKDQLIANLSHELRTPLTGIYTSALTMEDIGFADEELTRELTGVIVDQSADLTRMVEDLLVSAQADVGRLRFDLVPAEVAQLVLGLEREFERFDSHITLAIEPASVLADPGRLRQLMRNLISNAAKYGGGNVAVTGTEQEAHYRIDVRDDGPGVPAEVEDRMFERFVHRGDHPLIVGSVGLGLSISKVLAEGMGGTVAYQRIDNSTVFRVTLRRDPAHQLPPDPLPTVAPQLLDDNEEPTVRTAEMAISDLGLPTRIMRALTNAGVGDIRSLERLSAEELIALPGIGPVSVHVIGETVAELRSTKPSRT